MQKLFFLICYIFITQHLQAIQLKNYCEDTILKYTDTIEFDHNIVYIKGYYKSNKKVGIWDYRVLYSDYDRKFSVEYLDSGILFYPQNIVERGFTILIANENVYSIDYSSHILIRYFCNYVDGIYDCFSFNPRNKEIIRYKKDDIYHAFLFLEGRCSKELFMYILCRHK